MKVRFYANACVEIIAEDARILCDPWLVDGAFEGSWYHHPPLRTTPESLADYTHVYISHIHPDHCHLPSLERLPNKRPVLICASDQPFLRRTIERAGFPVIEIANGAEHSIAPGTTVTLFDAFTKNPLMSDAEIPNVIDSAMVVSSGGRTVLNANDNNPDPAGCALLRARFPQPFDLALLPYSGASAFPSCFENFEDAERAEKAEWKIQRYLQRLTDNARALAPRAVMPFAGQYVLGGRQAYKNRWLGVPDVQRAVAAVQAAGIEGIAAREGDEVDVDTLVCRNTLPPYRGPDLAAYLELIATHPYPFETAPRSAVDLLELAVAARQKVWRRQTEYGWFRDYNIVLQVGDARGRAFRFNFATPELVETTEATAPAPYMRVRMSESVLSQMLRRQVHWNNLSIGAHFDYFREPDLYLADVETLMCYFHA